MRRLTLAFALLLAFAAACGTPAGPRSSGPPAAGVSGDGKGTEGPSQRDQRTPRPGRTSISPDQRGDAPGVTVNDPDDGPVRPTYNDNGPVGSAAATLLRSSPARRLIVEIDYVAGRRPSAAAVDHLRRVLEREAAKPAGITMNIDQEMPQGSGSWTLDGIKDLERRYRQSRSEGSTATVWIAYLDGRFDANGNALGIAYRATGAALFPDRIGDAATAIVRAAAIERAVLVHEVGHLLGLVNLAIRSEYDHEDPDHPGHSKYETSVMYWAVNDMSITSLLSGGPPDDFGRYDRADLARIRGS